MLRHNTSLLGPIFRTFWKIKLLLAYLLNIRLFFDSHLHLVPSRVCRRSTSKIKIIGQSNYLFKHPPQFAKAKHRSMGHNVKCNTATCWVLHLQVIAVIRTWITSKSHGVNLWRAPTLHYKESFFRMKCKGALFLSLSLFYRLICSLYPSSWSYPMRLSGVDTHSSVED